MLKHIPNILSFCRILLIPVIVTLIALDNYVLAIIIFAISILTDLIDGYVARNFNAVSNIGKLLDPLADKLTQLSLIASLVWANIISHWILIILLVKELSTIIGAAFLYRKKVVIYSKWYGKFATVLLYLSVMVSLVFRQFNVTSEIFITLSNSLYIVTILMTFFSLSMYVKALHNKEFIDND